MIRPPPTPTLFPYTTLFRSDRLAGEVVLVRAAAAGGTRLALAGLRLDALLATREGLLVRGVRGPRFLVRAIEVRSAILRRDGGGDGEQRDGEQPFHAALSGRIF